MFPTLIEFCFGGVGGRTVQHLYKTTQSITVEICLLLAWSRALRKVRGTKLDKRLNTPDIKSDKVLCL